jgi:DNA-binding CsgD family transcriptional regulator
VADEHTPLLDVLPLVGRDAELALGRETLADAPGLVVAGLAGVGKTRFAAELVSAVFGADRPVLRIVGTRAAAAIPLGAFGALVPADATPDVLTINALAASLQSSDDHAPLVMLVDDAHLLDDSSTVLLHRLVLDGSATAVVTVRSREPVSDSVTALWKDGPCRRLELQALSVDESAALVHQVLPGAVDEAVVQRCWRLACGNPMLLREVLRGAVAGGALARRYGAWTWPGRFEVAPALSDLVSQRLATLSEPERELLAFVAFGEPLDMDVASSARGPGTLEALARAGLIAVEAEREVRLAHPLYGEVVRSDLTAPTVARLSRELAAAHPLPLADASAELRRVVWHVEAGLPLDWKVLLAASARAQVNDLALAARLARASVAAGGGMEASLRLADVLMNSAQLDQADALLARLAEEANEDRNRVSVASIRATSLLWLQARPGDAAAVLDDAVAMLDDPRHSIDLASLRLQALMLEGRVTDIVAVVADVLDSSLATDETKAGALIPGVASWLATGDLYTAIERCQAGLAIAARSADAFPVRDFLEYGIAVARLYLGDLEWAHERFTVLRRESACEGDDILRFLFSQGLGRVLMLRGQHDAAVRVLQEAVALLQVSPDLVAWNLGLLAGAQALAGDIDGGQQSLAEARERTTSPMFAVDRSRADALLAWARGEQSYAAAASIAAADAALELGQRLPALLCLHDAARFGATADALVRFEMLDGFPGKLFGALHAHVAAMAAGEPSQLVEVSQLLEALGCLSLAADAATAAAAAFATAGLQSRATRAAERARQLAGRVDADLPDLETLRTIALLTAREREVAKMAARGLSDRAIADTLKLSIRTVETHLHRAYTKLGLTSRAELAAYVVEY